MSDELGSRGELMIDELGWDEDVPFEGSKFKV